MHTVLVIGSAGAGKSTFALNLYDHLNIQSHNPELVNLDPSQQTTSEYHHDIRDYITTQNIMESTDLGPNSSILMAFSLMTENLSNMDLSGYIIVDMPGQIEIFVHCDSFINLMNFFKSEGQCVLVNIFDCFNFTSAEKFLSICMNQTICTSRCDIPTITLVSKCDLFGIKSEQQENTEKSDFKEKDDLREKDDSDIKNNKIDFIHENNKLEFNKDHLKTKLQQDIYDFLENNNILNFHIIHYDEENFQDIVFEINMLLQYYEDVECKDQRD